VVYVPGRTVKTMAAGFAWEGKTDARDAMVIANTARMRRDFLPVQPPTELVAKFALLVARTAPIWSRTGVSRQALPAPRCMDEARRNGSQERPGNFEGNGLVSCA
jgi:hypothetical protein